MAEQTKKKLAIINNEILNKGATPMKKKKHLDKWSRKEGNHQRTRARV